MSITVKHVPGTAGERPYDICGCPSWREHWQRFTRATRTTCAVIGCSNPVEVGAHVREKGTRTPYILGLCRSCNSSYRDEFFEVDERTRRAPVAYCLGCGVLNDLKPTDVVLRSPTAEQQLTLLRCLEGPANEQAVWLVMTPEGEERRVTFHAKSVRYA